MGSQEKDTAAPQGRILQDVAKDLFVTILRRNVSKPVSLDTPGCGRFRIGICIDEMDISPIKGATQNQIVDAAGLQPIIGSSSEDFSNSVVTPTPTPFIRLPIHTVHTAQSYLYTIIRDTHEFCCPCCPCCC